MPAMRGLLVLLGGQAMASMDGSILSVAAPSLQGSLRVSDTELQLVVAMYTTAFAALVVVGARLGDVIGPRRAFVLGLAAFTGASLVGGLAPSPAVLIVARAGQGAAAAVMTPQVLSIIQRQATGDGRARAIGAYSLILAVGVAAGQVLGGLLVGAHLLEAAWRPALLLNVPIGVALLVVARTRLPEVPTGDARHLDLPGAALLSAGLVGLVLCLTVGRESGGAGWVWPTLAGCAIALAGFVVTERRTAARRRDPLFDLAVVRLPGVAAGIAAVALIMGAYAGFLLSVTLHLQQALGFSPLRAGVTFAAYATGFAVASLSWSRTAPRVRRRLPVAGPLVMGAALAGIGAVAHGGAWPVAATTALLFVAGAGHACGFGPLTSRLTERVAPGQASDLSGLVLTAALLGGALGVAGFAGVYLDAAPQGSAAALALTTGVLAVALAVTAACAHRALAPRARRPAAAADQPAAGA